jgi:hypothetical protein
MAADWDKTAATVARDFTLFIAAVGGVSGWLMTGTPMGFALGVAIALIIDACVYCAIVPLLGVVLYHFAANAVFDWAGMNIPILYWIGLVSSVVFTIVITIFLIILVVSKA